jgi:ribosomal protein S12 methylthiotransferase
VEKVASVKKTTGTRTELVLALQPLILERFGAKANDLGLPQVPDEVKQERWERFMEAQQEISSEIFQGKVGREIDVLVDEIDEENEEAIARSPWDAPEIDGNVFLPGETDLKPGDMVRVRIVEAEEYDLVGERVTQ